MIRGITILWSLLALTAGICLYLLKHQVQVLEDELAALNRQIRMDRQAMHVLDAEWTYLNDPSRLRDLAEKHLGLQPMGPQQVATMAGLPRKVAEMKASPRSDEKAAAPKVRPGASSVVPELTSVRPPR